MKSKKHRFGDYCISYMTKEDVAKSAKENGLRYINSEETAFFSLDPKTDWCFSLKGNHYDALMYIKKTFYRKHYEEKFEYEIMKYVDNNQKLLIPNVL